ncbi:O-antigen translocase, partial [Escherichia coli]|nr:O-antigen translocase [Escherichia coli]
MKVYNVFILNGLSVFVKIATLLGLNKVFAIYLGTSGYALIGQIQNILNIAMVA